MAQQQRQHFGGQTDEYGNQIHQTNEYGNPLNSSGGELRTAGYGGEHGTTGGGYRGTQYGTTDISGGTAGYGGVHGTTGGGYSGTQRGATDVGAHKTTGYGGSHGDTGAVHSEMQHTTITHSATGAGGLDGRPHHGGDYGTTGAGIGTGADLGLGGGRRREHQDQYGTGIGTGADLGLGGHKGHDDQPVVTTTHIIATGVSYEQEGQDEEKKGIVDKILDKVPGPH